MQLAVDDDATLETNAHAAQWSAGRTTDRRSARLSGQHCGISDRCAALYFHRYPVDRQHHSVRHEPALSLSVMGDTARYRFPVSHPSDNRPEYAPYPAMW